MPFSSTMMKGFDSLDLCVCVSSSFRMEENDLRDPTWRETIVEIGKGAVKISERRHKNSPAVFFFISQLLRIAATFSGTANIKNMQRVCRYSWYFDPCVALQLSGSVQKVAEEAVTVRAVDSSLLKQDLQSCRLTGLCVKPSHILWLQLQLDSSWLVIDLINCFKIMQHNLTPNLLAQVSSIMVDYCTLFFHHFASDSILIEFFCVLI